MKSLMSLLFVLASILHDAENTELKFKQEHYNQNFYYGRSQKPIFQKSLKKIPRISEKKCADYARSLDYSATEVYMGSGASGELAPTEIGGRDAFIGEFPHMGALGWWTRNRDWKFQCGSSLISHKFLLTAAHCSKSLTNDVVIYEKPQIVRLGTNIINKRESYMTPYDAHIWRVIVYPDYTPLKSYYDVALVELESEIQFTRYIHPACLWSSFDTSSFESEVTTSGWGVLDQDGRVTTSILQVIDINIIDSIQCQNILKYYCSRRFCELREHQVCAGILAGGVDSCKGDSGGPLQVEVPSNSSRGVKMHFLIGVTSFGFGCALRNRPGVYTRVSSFIDWIESSVWPTDESQ